MPMRGRKGGKHEKQLTAVPGVGVQVHLQNNVGEDARGADYAAKVPLKQLSLVTHPPGNIAM